MRQMLLVGCVFLTAGCLGAGAGRAENRVASAEPSRLDYLWLTSLADTQRLLDLAAYRPETLRETP